MVFKVRPPTSILLDLFRRELWKEQRVLEYIPKRTGPGRLRKHFRSAQEVESELYHRNSVCTQLGPSSVPKVLDATNTYVEFEYVEGTRVYNVLKVLAGMERHHATANQARRLIIERCAVESRKVQNALIYGVETRQRKQNSYPICKKLMTLFELFNHCLELDLDLSKLEAEAIFAEKYLTALTCRVPFRDAAPKNLIMRWPEAWLGRLSVEDQHRLIGEELLNFELGREAQFCSCPIVNIDFSSCDEATVPEDDPIGLLLHESSWLGTIPTADMLLWQPVEQDPTRLAIGLIIRMYRLGGRRLSYRLVHADGYKARYCDESIAFYFRMLLKGFHELCPTVARAFPSILEATQRILNRLSEELYVTTDWFAEEYQPKACRYYRDLFPY